MGNRGDLYKAMAAAAEERDIPYKAQCHTQFLSRFPDK